MSHYKSTDWHLALVLALLTLASSLVYATLVPLGEPPDEYAHVTYVHEIANQGRWLPDYKNSRIINSDKANYLNHPPLYYTTLGVIGKVLGWDVVKHFKRYRTVSAAMVALGVFFWVLIARSIGLRVTETCIAIAATLSIPMFAYMGGSINNDALAYLGVAVYFYGLIHIRRRPARAWYIMALGATIAFLTKATASLFLVTFTLTWLFLYLRAGHKLSKTRHLLLAVTLVFVACAAYYLPTIAVYGTPFPHAGTLRASLSPPSDPASLPNCVWIFIKTMMGYLPVVVSGRSYFVYHGLLNAFFYLMLALPIVSWFIARWKMPASARRNAVDAAWIALAVTLTVHIFMVYRSYLGNGVYAGLQPRYYSYLLPGLFLIGFIGKQELHLRRYLLGPLACLAAIFFAVSAPLSVQAHASAEQATTRVTRLTFPKSGSAPKIVIPYVLATAASSHIDVYKVSAGKITLKGWAYDLKRHHPIHHILVLYRNSLIGVAAVSIPRADVARALHAQSARNSGFHIVVYNAPSGVNPCDIKLLVPPRNRGSQFSRLNNHFCSKPDTSR